MKKTSNYYGTYMWILQEILKKNQWLLWKLYASIARNVKKPTKTMDPYVGIAMNDECQQLFVAHMRVLQEMPKIPTAIMGLRCGYCNDYNMPTSILGLICGYCIFENLLMEFIIENDVGIICLKCVYCFKTLQVMWVLLY